MTIRQVKSEIQSAMTTSGMCENSHITGSEMKKIATVAERGGVTRGEARLFTDLLEKGHLLEPSHFMTEACPENPSSFFTVDTGAVKEANALFVRNNLPYGANEEAMRAKVQKALDTIEGYGEPLAKAPNVKSLHPLFLQDMRMVDGPRLDAYLNPKKSEFFLKITGAGMGGPHTVGPFWHGPFKFDAKKPVVSAANVEKMRGAVHQKMSQLQWKPASSGLPIGPRYERVHLMTERHPDGYSYTALVPAGSLNPTVPPSDPNKASYFFVERTGGLAGLTQIAGPISLKD